MSYNCMSKSLVNYQNSLGKLQTPSEVLPHSTKPPIRAIAADTCSGASRPLWRSAARERGRWQRHKRPDCERSSGTGTNCCDPSERWTMFRSQTECGHIIGSVATWSASTLRSGKRHTAAQIIMILDRGWLSLRRRTQSSSPPPDTRGSLVPAAADQCWRFRWCTTRTSEVTETARRPGHTGGAATRWSPTHVQVLRCRLRGARWRETHTRCHRTPPPAPLGDLPARVWLLFRTGVSLDILRVGLPAK